MGAQVFHLIGILTRHGQVTVDCLVTFTDGAVERLTVHYADRNTLTVSDGLRMRSIWRPNVTQVDVLCRGGTAYHSARQPAVPRLG